MNEPISFNRLILRAVLRQVSPMVIRLLSVSERMELSEFHRVIRLVLGWKNDLGISFVSTVRSSIAFAAKRRRKPCTVSFRQAYVTPCESDC
jgi:hypothetical protein